MRVADGVATAVVAAGQLLAAVSALQAEGYDLLVDLFAYDTPERGSRFDVVYLFHRLADNARTRVKVQVGEDQVVPSITSLYPAPTGTSGRSTTCMASPSAVIPTCDSS